ncbi:hypothetical protein O3G_MSEX007747 [Manduca sexta]|uniref:RNA-directed DNA polymerase n=1 Tax=Manduca sexta TaxID=7130 RepID=A0A921Z7J6_MANSE|nr:hypothetical protein O3G_MSEX007747 [Manduca sexta]
MPKRARTKTVRRYKSTNKPRHKRWRPWRQQDTSPENSSSESSCEEIKYKSGKAPTPFIMENIITAKADIIPLFDPENEMFVSQWINKIEQLASIHNWTDTIKSYFMQSRLTGMAKVWHSSLQHYDMTWEEWKKQLLEAFPRNIDFVESLREMLAKRKTPIESMTQYFYNKNAMLTRLEISGEKAVACLIDGLPMHMRPPARAGNYSNPSELYSKFLSVMEEIKPKSTQTSRQASFNPTIDQQSELKEVRKPILCFLCQGTGHTVRRCPKNSYNNKSPCPHCGKHGHLPERCWYKPGTSQSATVSTSTLNEKQETVNLLSELNSDTPVCYRPYRLSMPEKSIVRDKIDDLLKNNIIRESSSAYASPIILVRKKGGDYRLCVDYRKLNSMTVKDKYPLPVIEEQVEKLSGKRFFSTLDLSQGFYQIPLHKDSIPKTGFVTPEGHYEFIRMPFGLANSPCVFQRLMDKILGALRFETVLPYIDDILIPSVTEEQGLETLKIVLEIIRDAKLTLNIEKCTFLESEIEYLGYEISEKGIRPGHKKIEAVTKYKEPCNIHELRMFLGLTSYFRKFVKNYAILSHDLYQLLKKNRPWEWGPQQQTTFDLLKRILTDRPLLALYNPKAKTEVHTDASSKGIAGILLQKSNGVLRPVAYYSRKTTKEEALYHSFELETLAVVDSLKRFRIYLAGIQFKVITDCVAVRQTFEKKDLLPRVARWWLSIQEYNMDIEHKPGLSHKHVDALSRTPVNTIEVLVLDILDWVVCLQNRDSTIGVIKHKLENNVTDPDIANNYVLQDNKLYRKIINDQLRLVIPKAARWNIMRKYHDDIGHPGLKRCDEIVKDNCWFPRMTRFIKKYVNACIDCLYKRGQYGKPEGNLHPIQKIAEPMDTKKASAYMKKRFDEKRRKPTEYKIGDLVLWKGAQGKNKESVRKLKEKFSGPYKIKKVLGNDRYLIVSIKGLKGYKNYQATVASDALRRFVEDNGSDTDSSESQLDPTDWGWKLVDNTLEPVQTLLSPAPEILLNTIFCNCKKGCSAKCGCKKVGLFCSLACTNCQGRSCSNVESLTEEDSCDSYEDTSPLTQFTCTQNEEEEEREEFDEQPLLPASHSVMMAARGFGRVIAIFLCVAVCVEGYPSGSTSLTDSLNLFSKILLEPFLKKYGSPHYSSGIIKIATARGNRQLYYGQNDYSNKMLYGGPIMDLDCRETLLFTKLRRDGSAWGDNFHVYSLEWTPGNILSSFTLNYLMLLLKLMNF